MIVFSLTGGITAQDSELTLDPDGAALAVVHGYRSTGRVAAGELEAIVSELDASGLFTGDPGTGERTFGPPWGFDLQRYSITYRGATVVAYDTTVPPELVRVIALLQNALRGVQLGR